MSDLYAATLLTSRVPGLARVEIHSAVVQPANGHRYLSARLALTTDDAGIRTEISVPLDPCTMRAMARVLGEHATRIGVELVPLLNGPSIAPAAREPGQEVA